MKLTVYRNNIYSNRVPLNAFSDNYSILLDGVDEYINIDALQSATASNTNGTISIWVKPVDATPSSNEFLFSFGDTNADTRISGFIRTDGTVRFEAKTAGGIWWRVTTDAALLSDGTWGHLSFVQDGATPRIDFNGTTPAQTTTSVSDITYWFNGIGDIDNGRLGCKNDDSLGNILFFNGNIDDFLYTSDAKTLAQIQDIYNSGTPKDESGITNGVSYYLMGDASGDNYNSGVASEWQFIDQIGSNNAYTVNCEEADVETDTP
jgi:hypothetical protein